MKNPNAFPLHLLPEDEGYYPGMKLREYYAASAITASANVHTDPKKIAQYAFEIADAMLNTPPLSE